MEDVSECERITRRGTRIAAWATGIILAGVVLWFGGRLVLGLIIAATYCGLSC